MNQQHSTQLTAFSIDSGIATIELLRPRQRNALSPELIRALITTFEQLDEHPTVKVVVLQGTGISFCVGFDLLAMGNLLMTSDRLSEEQVRETALMGRELIDAIRDVSAITIARVQGHAMGGGFLMALACDLCVASETTVLGIPEIDVGLPLLWGGVNLAFSELGPPLARDLILTGRQFSPTEISHTGFPHRVVSDNKLDESLKELARELASKPAPALKAIKKQFKSIESRAVADDAALFQETALHPDFLEGAMRYLKTLKSRH